MWGFFPLVFQAVGRRGVAPWEILAHRSLWSAPTALLLVLGAHQLQPLKDVLRNPRVMGWLLLSATLLATNWIIFISAVNTGRLLEASLGYYIIPLISVAAGAIFFRERIETVGLLAIVLAALGVVLQAFAIGSLPFVSLLLAVSFGGYGIVRKQVAAEAQTGLFVECLFIGVPALVYIVWLEESGTGHFSGSVTTILLLIAVGPITAIPLALFAWAARRIPLSALGFLQFVAPTITFLIGVAQGEVFTPLRALSFAFIWMGGAVFSINAWWRNRARPAGQNTL
jgi:chloramphenicol-sensitive protein RarD